MIWVYLLGGIMFGLGLSISMMTAPEVVLSFLQLQDFGLLIVLMTAVVVSIVGFHLLPLLSPTIKKRYAKNEPFSSTFDKKTVYGAAIFGVGWGVSGVCPGAALASVGTGNWPVLFAILGIFIGVFVFKKTEKYFS